MYYKGGQPAFNGTFLYKAFKTVLLHMDANKSSWAETKGQLYLCQKEPLEET